MRVWTTFRCCASHARTNPERTGALHECRRAVGPRIAWAAGVPRPGMNPPSRPPPSGVGPYPSALARTCRGSQRLGYWGGHAPQQPPHEAVHLTQEGVRASTSALRCRRAQNGPVVGRRLLHQGGRATGVVVHVEFDVAQARVRGRSEQDRARHACRNRTPRKLGKKCVASA